MIAEIKVSRNEGSQWFLNPPNWVNLYADSLYRFALTKVDDSEIAKELVQETFLAGLEKVEKFEGRCSEKTWLCAILKYKAIDVYRKKSRQAISYLEIPDSSMDDDDEEHLYGDLTGGSGYLPRSLWVEERDRMVEKEFYQALNNCLEQLPSLWMDVFTMRFIEERSTGFICEALNISQANVWVIIHRIRNCLKKSLSRYWI